MNDWKIINEQTDQESFFDTEQAARDEKRELLDLFDESVLRVEPVGNSKSQESAAESTEEITSPKQPEVVEAKPDEPEAAESQSQPLKAVPMPDPLHTVPDWMQTKIQHGTDESIDLNKRGTQVIANALDLQVMAECEVAAASNDFEYARYRATVETPDGRTYNAVGDAHIDESGNQAHDLERLAETRAKKRAVKWSCGGGIQPFLGDE